MRRNIAVAVPLIACALGFGLMSFAAPVGAAASKTMKAIDTDSDSTIDLNEAKTAATAVFDKLDRDHDGTLDQRELGSRMTKKDFRRRRSRP